MLSYCEKEVIMIPMALNAFYYNIPIGTKRITFAETVSIGEEFLEEVFEFINQNAVGKYIIIDMKNADYAFRLFEKFIQIDAQVVFVNIESNMLREKMKENIPNLQMSSNEQSGVLNMNYDRVAEKICLEYSSICDHKIYVEIVQSIIDNIPDDPIEPQKLDSSGLYSNMYINVKKLFLYPEKYYAIAFGLAQKIVKKELEFDGFVSSSKNGALLANLLGMMLNKKTIHIMGLGPKYSMNIGNVQKEIKRRKNYIYVFDFRCTGTEMKVLSALVNANDAYIQGSIGIATYKNDNDVKNMMCLVNISDEKIPYKIAGDREDIIKLMQ